MEDLLRTIAPRFRVLLEKYNSEELSDESREAIEQQMLEDDSLLEEKADAMADYIAHYKSKAMVKEIEEERLRSLRERDERKAERLRKHLAAILYTSGKTKFSTPFHSYWFKKSKRVEIYEAGVVPVKYLREKPATYEPDKVLIKKAIEDGLPVNGCGLKEESYLQIQ